MDYKNFKKEDFFFCYSITLFHFLKANGFYYLFKERNENTNKYYWVFERTSEFSKALDVYMRNKPK